MVSQVGGGGTGKYTGKYLERWVRARNFRLHCDLHLEDYPECPAFSKLTPALLALS